MKNHFNFPLNHDLHVHSNLSDCCQDPWLTPENLLAFADANDYDAICLTDHAWEAGVPGADEWYRQQPLEHVRQALPLPQGKTPFYFGVETEYLGENHLGLRPQSFDLFDFVVIPINHFHKVGFVRPKDCDTPAKVAALFLQRLEEVLLLDLDWPKVGIPHLSSPLTFPEGDPCDVFRLMDENRLAQVFAEFSDRGVGIELNADSFFSMQEDPENNLKLYHLAHEAGCKFYLSSDAHQKEALARMQGRLAPIVEALGLQSKDRYLLPSQKKRGE